MALPKYTRLTGWRRRWVSIDSLWQAEDHILLVQRNGFTESYRRYYFGNIQGFVVTPTSAALKIAALCGIPSLLGFLVTTLALMNQFEIGWCVAVDVFALPCFVGFLVNGWRGGTCTTHLCTAVGDVVVVPLGRQRDALRVIERLSGPIYSAQGPLDPQWLAQLAASAQATRAKVGV